jgi:hypothetical protein
MQRQAKAFKIGWWLASGCVVVLLAVGVFLWIGKGEGERGKGAEIVDRGGDRQEVGGKGEEQEVVALRLLPRSGGAAAGQPITTTRTRTTIAEREKQGRPRYRKAPAAPGQRVTARVQVGGRAYDLTPNQVGNFQRIYVQPGETIPVQVAYEEGKAGEPVAVSAEDGGGVWQGVSGKGQGAGGTGTAATLDERLRIAFNFKATEHRGIHRVVLRKGADVKVLDFWVGAELPVAGR